MKVATILSLASFVSLGPVWASDVRSMDIVGDSASAGAIASRDFTA